MELINEIARQKQLMNIDSQDIETAKLLGKQAFLSGKKRIPAHDVELMELLKKHPEMGDGVPYMKAWITAWDKENFNAPWES